MKNFYRVALTIALSLSVFIAGLSTSRRGGAAVLALLFTSPDGTPCQPRCLFGIQPHSMPHNRAVAYLLTHPLIQSSDQSVEVSDPGGDVTRVRTSTYIIMIGRDDLGQVGYVTVQVLTQGVSTGDVIHMFGPAPRPQISSINSGGFCLCYSGDLAFYGVNNGRHIIGSFDPFDRINFIVTGTINQKLIGNVKTLHWKGFAGIGSRVTLHDLETQ